LKDSSIQLEAEDGELWNAHESSIIDMCAKGALVVEVDDTTQGYAKPLVSRDLASYPEEIQKRARRRQAYIECLLRHGPMIFAANKIKPRILSIAKELGDNTPPSPASIFRWHRHYIAGGNDITVLADKWERKGRKRKWESEIYEVVRDAVNEVLLNRQQYPRKMVCEMVVHKVTNLNCEREKDQQLKKPSRATLYRYMQQIESYEIAAGRLGKAEADRKYRMVLGTQKATRILERWEVDHTPLNLLVFCNISKLPIGRPWLTAIIDKHSRMIMGFYIGFHTPSTYAVLQCLKQAILPKDELLRKFSHISTPWPARGIPEVIACDNGMELHSKALAQACLELGVQILFCPAKQPEYKGAIERFLRTINHDLIHRLPGTVFSNPSERGQYESENLASIDFETLVHLVTKWIVEVYANTLHRGIGMTPLQKWNIGERERIIEYPAEPAQMDVIIGHTAERRVFHYGVEVNNQRYNNPELQVLRRRYGENLRVNLKHYEDDLGYVYVFDSDHKAYIQVEAIDHEYASGLRLIQHDFIRERLREESQSPDNQINLLRKKQELQQLIDAASNNKKMAKRKQSQVIRGINSAAEIVKIHSDRTKKPKPQRPCLPPLSSASLPKFDVSIRKDEGDCEQGSGGVQ
jgi:putative transposase